jgi:hypothetical protein
MMLRSSIGMSPICSSIVLMESLEDAFLKRRFIMSFHSAMGDCMEDMPVP